MKQKTTVTAKENKITEGVIWQQLLLFFFPILFGTFFQQLYNAADAMIVGQFVGKEALSAVGGGTGTIINLLVGFFVGISSGATVIISQYYGAKREEMVGYAVHTAIAFCLAAGVLLMIGGIVAAPMILRAMDTPADVLDLSVLYIRIYFAGVIGNLIYNIGAGILRAVGDSKRPLYFLIASCLTNIVLDVVFVVFWNMGVAGAALATILSQALSAVLVIMVLIRTKDMHHLDIRKIGIDKRMFGRIIRIGLPAGLSSIMYSSSNVLIQSSVNSLGTDTVAAWTAYSKIDSIFWMIISAFGISITTFVGQNYGAGKMERVRKGIRVCMGMSLATTIVISLLLYFVGVHFYSLFTKDAAVIEIGIYILQYLVPVYFTYVAIEIFSGSLRGVGDCWMPTVISFVGICVIRVLWNLFAVPMKREMVTIMFSYPLTWVITSILYIVYYLFFSKLKVKKVLTSS
ncbi:MAG: MATE family efflux transporter [Lachnospiraceae bacterium]|nr:MATE family efflux transporter [Lachnospiraceae bacterium]